MYVTLEPCCHHGKQPPCTDAIIAHGIRKVYIGSADPNPLVCGKGAAILREHGIEVQEHVLEEECDALNPVFFHYIRKKRPYVALKYAMTLDGKTATHTGASKWITGEKAREHVQKLRNRYKGIMVGIGTVLLDDPMLNCRMEGGRNPVRIICDSGLRIPLDSKIVQTARDIPTIVATLKGADPTKQQELQEYGVTVVAVPQEFGHLSLSGLMEYLGEHGIDGILLEGGGTLAEAMLYRGLVNKVYAFVAPKIFGGSGTYTPVSGGGVEMPDDAWKFHLQEIEQFDEDILLTYIRQQQEGKG